MARRLLDYDPFTGVSTFHEYDSLTDTTIISEQQDVQAAVDYAKNKAKDEDKSRKGRKRGMWHVATIPVGVQYKWMKDHGVNIYDKSHKTRLNRLLNDPDYRYLRTATGRI